jgi:hypothetical protein
LKSPAIIKGFLGYFSNKPLEILSTAFKRFEFSFDLPGGIYTLIRFMKVPFFLNVENRMFSFTYFTYLLKSDGEWREITPPF